MRAADDTAKMLALLYAVDDGHMRDPNRRALEGALDDVSEFIKLVESQRLHAVDKSPAGIFASMARGMAEDARFLASIERDYARGVFNAPEDK
jgi:hypothetical protein